MSYDEDGNRKPHGLSKAEIRRVSYQVDLKVILIKLIFVVQQTNHGETKTSSD